MRLRIAQLHLYNVEQFLANKLQTILVHPAIFSARGAKPWLSFGHPLPCQILIQFTHRVHPLNVSIVHFLHPAMRIDRSSSSTDGEACPLEWLRQP